ncbi:PDR/VanB family oxidoreductase [Pararhodobacter aggregans]|nr:PDR/VanB family oxidoreductase [Pararhodobacter aggregans]PTX03398.1 vanillate demethylase subunit B [Pararhodobacter aggregans]
MSDLIEATIVATARPCPDVAQIDLLPHGEGIVFEPGGHIDVHLPLEGGVQVRSYSHVAIGPDRSLRIAVKLLPDSRGGSRAMGRLRPGDRIRISAARNDFPLSFAAPRHAFLAGGIGITPILAQARALKAAGRGFTLHYCVRDRASGPWIAEMEAEFGASFTLHDDSAQGLLDARAFVAALDPETELYMCGPYPMMAAVKSAWAAAGRAPARLRYESFANSGASESVPFSVRVVETGAEVTVRRDQSLLDALLMAGQPVMYDCRRGECGLCKVEIEEIDGDIDHRDVFLGDQGRKGALCACVSRLRGGTAQIRIDSISHGPSV